MSRHLDYWSNLERSNYRLWLGFWAMTGLALLEAWSSDNRVPYISCRAPSRPVCPGPALGWSWWRRITHNATC